MHIIWLRLGIPLVYIGHFVFSLDREKIRIFSSQTTSHKKYGTSSLNNKDNSKSRIQHNYIWRNSFNNQIKNDHNSNVQAGTVEKVSKISQ